MGLRGGGTCVSNAPRQAGYREPPLAATPCRNTKAARAKPVRNPPIADRKRDGKLPTGSVLPQNRILQTKIGHTGVKHCFIGNRANRCIRNGGLVQRFPPPAQRQTLLEVPIQPSRIMGPLTLWKQTIGSNACEGTAAKTSFRPPNIASLQPARDQTASF